MRYIAHITYNTLHFLSGGEVAQVGRRDRIEGPRPKTDWHFNWRQISCMSIHASTLGRVHVQGLKWDRG